MDREFLKELWKEESELCIIVTHVVFGGVTRCLVTGLRGAQQAVMDIVGTVMGSSCTRGAQGFASSNSS